MATQIKTSDRQIKVFKTSNRIQATMELRADVVADEREFTGGVVDTTGKLTDAQKAEVMSVQADRDAAVAAARAAGDDLAIFRARKAAADDAINLAEKFANGR
jgi:hypothetical protein